MDMCTQHLYRIYTFSRLFGNFGICTRTCSGKVGLIGGLFFGLAFGIAGIASAILGKIADETSIQHVYDICAYLPLIGLVAAFLPNTKKEKV